jgi:hypothetical protein
MFFLASDIGFHLPDVGRTDGKRPIPILPMEMDEARSFLLDANRRTGFHFFDQLSDCHRAMQGAKNMHVIVHRVDDQGRTLDVSQNSNHVTRYDSTKVRSIQEGMAILGAEYEMNQNVG